VTASKDAIGAATASDVGFAVGGVLAAAGVIVVLTAPSGVHVAPAVGQGYGGLTVAGDW
jgi:hypothetical protein